MHNGQRVNDCSAIMTMQPPESTLFNALKDSREPMAKWLQVTIS